MNQEEMREYAEWSDSVDAETTDADLERMYQEWLSRQDQEMHFVRNLMTGKLVAERVDTPWSCSVASETFWCS